MTKLLDLMLVITRLYTACRSTYPGVRQEALRLWSNTQQLIIKDAPGASVHSAHFYPLRDIVKDLTERKEFEGVGRSEQAMKCLTKGCQLILYRLTDKRRTLPAADVEYLLSIGVDSHWRPHLLRDWLWYGDGVSGDGVSGTGPFELLAEDDDFLLVNGFEADLEDDRLAVL